MTVHPDAAEFTPIRGQLARAFLKHRASMGLGDADDAWILEHVSDISGAVTENGGGRAATGDMDSEVSRLSIGRVLAAAIALSIGFTWTSALTEDRWRHIDSDLKWDTKSVARSNAVVSVWYEGRGAA